jgi:hypothetical protein
MIPYKLFFFCVNLKSKFANNKVHCLNKYGNINKSFFSSETSNFLEQHESCEFEPSSWRGVLDTTLCDKVCQ